MTDLTENFESRLLRELQRLVAEQPACGSPLAARPRSARRRLLPAAGMAAAVAAAVAVLLGSDAGSPGPAYAVDRAADGTVTVKIRSLSDAAGLERSLREAGVPAVVDYVPAPENKCPAPGASAPGADGAGSRGPSLDRSTEGSDAGPNHSSPRPGPGATTNKVQAGAATSKDAGNDEVTFTIDPRSIKPGEKVYITTATAGNSIAMAVTAPARVDPKKKLAEPPPSATCLP